MHTLFRILLVCAIVIFVADGMETACASGEFCPEYNREDKVYGARVKADLKRYASSQGVPERLMYLYDQLGDCPECLGGDAEHPILPYLYIVYSPDAQVRAGGLRNVRNRGTGWSADEEYAARQGMRDGYIEAFYILLEETPCECCRASTQEEFDEWNDNEPDYDDAPTWNDDLRIDTSRSDAHENADELGPDPEDLTEIDAKDRYPDELPLPPLDLAPPVRPLTTGCGECQALVDEHNDLAIHINEQNRVVAQHERNLKIGQVAIRFVLREIRAHERKAQNDTWEAEYDRMWQHYGDLVATSQKDQQRLDIQLAKRAELRAQLALLRDAIIDCEARCRLLEGQPAPSTDPDPLIVPSAGDAPALPPYVRMSTGACLTCVEAEERRNELARDMNELVQGMIDAGVNGNSIAAWAGLRAELEAANQALRECAERCASQAIENNEVLMSGESFSGEMESCPPCRFLQERYDYWIGEEFRTYRQYFVLRDAIDELVREKYKAGGELSEWEENRAVVYGPQAVPDPDKLHEIDLEIRRLRKQADELEQMRRRINLRLHEAALRLRHCIVTQCGDEFDFRPDTSFTPGQFNTPEVLLAVRRYFFVSTSCEKCRDQARSINDWVMKVHQEWMTQEFMGLLAEYRNNDDSTIIAARVRFLGFLSDLEERLEALRECEKSFCPVTHGDPTQGAYQEPNIATAQCLDDSRTKAAVDSGDSQSLPASCNRSWLQRWIEDCDESCFGVDDIAVEDNSAAAAACSDNGIPIADYLTEFGVSQWFSYRLPACSFSPASDIEGAELGRERYLLAPVSGAPNDAYYQSENSIRPGLADQWGIHRIGSFEVLAGEPTQLVTAVTTVVAIIDSGVDSRHPDLNGVLQTNRGEIAANGRDDDQNGFVDDILGWNFVQDNNNVEDRNGHGTLVAGIVGAASNNAAGITGVNPWARILPIKVMNFIGRGNSTDIAAAITYAVNEGARVINVSLGGAEFSRAEQAAVRYADSKGVLVVVAAGNQSIDASNYWPAGLDNVITVAAVESDDGRARYSNWGSPVDIAAPGSDILSLRARHTDLMYFVEDDYPLGRNIVGNDGQLYYASGTSFAAPFVSGVASLLFSLHPELTAPQARRMLLHSARDIETPGIDALTGFGLLDARAALSADPDYFVDAAITGVGTTRRDGMLMVQVAGSTDASRFESAEIQFGAGRSPNNWKVAGSSIASPVRDGLLTEINASELRGSPTWTLRLITMHRDGSRREARFALDLQ